MPEPIRKIVAATDFSFASHRAARRAGMIARTHGAALHLLHVMNDAPTSGTVPRFSNPDAETRLRDEATRNLQSLADDVVKMTGAAATHVVREGRAMTEILAAAEHADLLVLGRRGLNPVRDFLLGSTAERMARMVAAPTLVANQDPQIPYEHVFVPVDFSDYSAAALTFAAQFAPGATLHVYHALDDSVERSLRTAGVAAEAIESFRSSLARDAHAELAELTVGFPAPTVSIAESGDARGTIVRRAAELGCTLIVMGKQGRSWLAEHLIGGVTRHVLEHAECDVVVVPLSA